MAEHIAVSAEDCIGCNLCLEVCPASPRVFKMDGITAVVVNEESCEDCMLCMENCPTNAIIVTRAQEETL